MKTIHQKLLPCETLCQSCKQKKSTSAQRREQIWQYEQGSDQWEAEASKEKKKDIVKQIKDSHCIQAYMLYFFQLMFIFFSISKESKTPKSNTCWCSAFINISPIKPHFEYIFMCFTLLKLLTCNFKNHQDSAALLEKMVKTCELKSRNLNLKINNTIFR